MRLLLVILLLALSSTALAAPLWSGDRGSVEVDQPLLDRLMAGTESSFQVTVEGLVLDVQVEEITGPNLGVSSLRGRLEGGGLSFFLLCRTETGATVAFFQTAAGEAYRLDRTSGQDALRMVDQANMGSCGGALDPTKLGDSAPGQIPPDEPVMRHHSRDLADDGSRQDILMAYTPAAEAAVGGWDQIRAECQLAVDAANLAYDLSGFSSDLNLVHVMGTNYDEDEAWDYEEHVEFLYYPNDEQMDDVPVMRDRVGADFVSVLIDGRDNFGNVRTCGIAPVMQAGQDNPLFAPLALSVVSVQCAADNWSLAHEVGHNRGCAHNREDAEVLGPFSYGFGHRWFDGDGTGQRTIMSYDSAPFGEPPVYARIPYFSNPDATYFGDPTGVPVGQVGEAHNAQVHINTAEVCSQFRTEHTFVLWGFSGVANGLLLSPFASLSEGLAASGDGGAIVFLNDNPGFSGVLDQPRSYLVDDGDAVVLGGN